MHALDLSRVCHPGHIEPGSQYEVAQESKPLLGPLIEPALRIGL